MPANRTFDFPVRTATGSSKRLLSGARRSARLAFPGNDAHLHSEFQVGVKEPQDLPSEIDRAKKVRGTCQTHADDLGDQSWTDEDTDALAVSIDLRDGGDTEHETAKDNKKGFTQGCNLAANALYKQCISVQNAARLAYPSNKAAKDEAILVARNRFLLEEFPPRGGASAADKPATPLAA